MMQELVANGPFETAFEVYEGGFPVIIAFALRD